jgi:hypothetical protein
MSGWYSLTGLMGRNNLAPIGSMQDVLPHTLTSVFDLHALDEKMRLITIVDAATQYKEAILDPAAPILCQT